MPENKIWDELTARLERAEAENVRLKQTVEEYRKADIDTRNALAGDRKLNPAVPSNARLVVELVGRYERVKSENEERARALGRIQEAAGGADDDRGLFALGWLEWSLRVIRDIRQRERDSDGRWRRLATAAGFDFAIGPVELHMVERRIKEMRETSDTEAVRLVRDLHSWIHADHISADLVVRLSSRVIERIKRIAEGNDK